MRERLRAWLRRWLGVTDAPSMLLDELKWLSSKVGDLAYEFDQMRAADLNSVLPDADRVTLAHLEDRVRALEKQLGAKDAPS